MTKADRTRDPQNVPNFDRAAFDKLVDEMGGEAAFRVLDVFFEESEARFALLRGLRGVGQAEVIAREAHSMKGSAATFAFARMSRLAFVLERMAATIGEKDFSSLLGRIETAFAAARAQVPDRATIGA